MLTDITKAMIKFMITFFLILFIGKMIYDKFGKGMDRVAFKILEIIGIKKQQNNPTEKKQENEKEVQPNVKN